MLNDADNLFFFLLLGVKQKNVVMHDTCILQSSLLIGEYFSWSKLKWSWLWDRINTQVNSKIYQTSMFKKHLYILSGKVIWLWILPLCCAKVIFLCHFDYCWLLVVWWQHNMKIQLISSYVSLSKYMRLIIKFWLHNMYFSINSSMYSATPISSSTF